MASIYRIYDRDFNVIEKVLVYGQDFVENHIEYDLQEADSTLTFECMGGAVPEEIEVEGYIETEDQIYVIKEISGTAVTCRLNLEDLEAYSIEQFTASNQSIVPTAEAAITGTGWTVQSIVDGTKFRSVQQFKKTPLEILFKIRDAWMCEIQFDSKKKIVKFADEFGAERGSYFIDDLNLKTVRRTVDGYDFYTRIYPLGKDGLNIASVNDGNLYLENHQYSDKDIMLTWEDTSYEDPQALMDDAAAKLADLSTPKIAYSAEICDLQKIHEQDTDTLKDETNVTLQDELGFDLEDQGEYAFFTLSLGDTVKIISKQNKIHDRQRIVKMISYPDDPERNTVEMANTILTWEEMQARLKSAVDAWEDISNSDGTVNGVYVHGVQAGEVVGIEVVVNGNTVVSDYDLSTINVNGTNDSLIALINRSGNTQPTRSTRLLNAPALRSGAAEVDQNEDEFFKLKAKVIDVDDLFAQNITATGTISGATLTGAHVETDTGSIGDWEITNEGIRKEEEREYTPGDTTHYNFITNIYPTDIVFEKWGNDDGYAHPFSLQKVEVVSTMITSADYSYNPSTGAETNHHISAITPTFIREDNTNLSNKYAPKSNSDPVLKENIKQSKLDALELLKRLPLHSFDWKKDGKHWDVGFIAPELYDIDQNMAEPPDGTHGSYWSVNSFYLIGVLTKAVQELTKRIEDLENRQEGRR